MPKKSTDSQSLPDKRYFRMGEVCNITGLKAHVLRYWETEFPQIQPAKSSKNQRLYRKKDVEAIFAIKQLLYDRGFTIAGAKKALKKSGVQKEILIKESGSQKDLVRQMQLDFKSEDYPALLRHMLEELKAIRRALDK